jgi:hypothetical protein
MKEKSTSFEQKLFKSADKLRKNIDAAEYKYVVLGLIFIKYISETFNELYYKLESDEYSDPEDRDEYLAENIFFVPSNARWSHLHNNAKLSSIGEIIDEAMESIEKENKELKNVLPKVYGKENLDKTSLGELIDLISNTELQAENEKSKDLFGRVYEYFLGEFANAEGKKGGQFYTPKAIVKLMVEMIEPYKGRVYDPACGSGGMFVMSEKFVTEHQGNIKDITVYGQESNQTTWKLSKMNLAIRNINSQFVVWNTEGSFLKDAHPDLKADYILANPPFNQKDGELDYYHLKIENSKKKSRTIPITDVIYSWNEPPKGVPFRKRERNETDKFDIWETNIVDVIFELFYPKEHAKTFPSPNLNEKPNKGYSNNWYMNLFKERLVNSEDCNWKKYGIQSSHHLRSYFVSYMFLQDVRVEDVIEITGHSYSTAMGYYRRINTKMMRDTLSHRDLRTILNKNKITNQKK